MDQSAEKASRRPRADGLKNREKLLEAAKAVFSAGGAGASLEAVAKRAGVGIGTLYRHFPTREALFEAVYRREVDELAALATELAGREEPMAALRTWAAATVEMVATKKGMLTALALAADGRPELYAYSGEAMRQALGTLLAAGRAAGAIRPDVTAEEVMRATYGLIGSCHSDGAPGWQVAALRLLEVFLDGLRVPPG